ncbi:hypothetical protein MSS93_11130 [Deinococcus radiodurans]|nr:hypothetical protein MSS93_11130 [Deinococcus radiodurans]
MSDLRALVLSGHIAEAAEVLASLTEPQTADLTWAATPCSFWVNGLRPSCCCAAPPRRAACRHASS